MSSETNQQTDGREREWTDFEYRAPTLTSAVALGGALLTVAALAQGSVIHSAVAGLGGVVLVAGLVQGIRKLVTVGAAVLFGAVVVGALRGGAVVPIVAAGAGTLLAFDAGRYAVKLGSQVGAAGKTLSAELRHVGVTVAVVIASAVVGTGTYLLAPQEQPALALFALVLAAVLFVSGLTVGSGKSAQKASSR